MSSQYRLVVLETTGIQSYIFNSNRLRENIGASYLVKAATQDWVRDHDIIGSKTPICELGEQTPIENRQNDANAIELLYCGGGNTVLLFRDKQKATEFTRTLSRKVLRDARGLRVVFHHADFNWDNESLADAVSEALKTLKSERNNQPPRMGIGGLGVTAMCTSTSLPAVTLSQAEKNDFEMISAEVLAKRKNTNNANDELRKSFCLADKYTFPLDLDNMGQEKGEKNTIAVVHADGNGLGEIIQGIKNAFQSPEDNRSYIIFMRQFSEGVKALAQNAQKAMVKFLIHSQFMENKKDKTLPFRPLVSGGDDVTFVCDGRIGISMAVKFLEEFENLSKNFIQKLNEMLINMRKDPLTYTKLTACAGIAIVNTKYPFARAYDLAEELCSNAKKARKHHQIEASAFDWHYTTGGLYDNLSEMRTREYARSDGQVLHSRPVTLDAPPLQTWGQLRANIQIFEGWGEYHNKTKGLMDAIRANDVANFTAKYLFNKEGKPLSTPSGEPHTWYDALELVDLYIDLHKTSESEGK